MLALALRRQPIALHEVVAKDGVRAVERPRRHLRSGILHKERDRVFHALKTDCRYEVVRLPHAEKTLLCELKPPTSCAIVFCSLLVHPTSRTTNVRLPFKRAKAILIRLLRIVINRRRFSPRLPAIIVTEGRRHFYVRNWLLRNRINYVSANSGHIRTGTQAVYEGNHHCHIFHLNFLPIQVIQTTDTQNNRLCF